MHGNDTMEVSFTLGAISEVRVNVLTGHFLLTPWPCVLELGHWYNGQSGQCSFSRTIAVARTQPPAHMLRTWYGGWLCTGSLSLAGWRGGTWHTLCLGLSTQPSPFSGRDLLNVVCYSMQIGHNRKLAPVDGLSQTFGDFFFFFFLKQWLADRHQDRIWVACIVQPRDLSREAPLQFVAAWPA